MVAAQPVRCLPAAMAAMICLMLLTPVFPMADAQVNTHGIITVKQGDVHFVQNGKRTPFLDNGTASIRAFIENSGAGTIENVPVWFVVKTHALDNSGTVVRAKCVAVTVPGRTSASSPGNTTAEWPSFDTTSLASGPYDVYVRVNARTPSDAPASALPCGTTPITPQEPPAVNTSARGYFVKSLLPDYVIEGIRWCAYVNSTPTCDETLDGGAYNVTGSGNTFFEAVVNNNGTWPYNTDYGRRGNGTDSFEWDLDFRLNGPFVAANTNITGSRPRGIEPVRSANVDQISLGGIYTVTARIDPLGKLRQTSIANDVATKQVEIKWADLAVNFTASDFRTTPENPYPYSGEIHIRGNITFRNDGPGDVKYNDTAWRVYLDDGRFLNFTGVNSSSDNIIRARSSWTRQFDFLVTASASNDNTITPGKHTIYAQYDSSVYAHRESGWNQVFESDETNNNVTLDIYIADNDAPTVDTPKITPGVGSYNRAVIDEVRPHETFTASVNATDKETSALNVTAVFTLDSDPNVTRSYKLNRVIANGARYAAPITDFTFAGNGTGENWTMRIRAADSFNNNVTTSTVPIRLVPWGIHNLSAAAIVLTMAEGANLSWGGSDAVTYHILVPENATGIPNQYNHTKNLAFNITTPLGVTHNYNGSFWTPQARCQASSSSSPLPDDVTNKVRAEDCLLIANRDEFKIIWDKSSDGSAPGKWNVSIRIKDLAGFERVINRTFNLVDAPPTIDATSLEPQAVEPGQTFTVKANFTDDFRVERAHLNFSRVSDGRLVNLTLTNPKMGAVNGSTFYSYNNTFKTGRGEMFGIGGTFNVSVEAVDQNGNWNRSALGNFTLNDTRPPEVHAIGAAPALQEIGQDVTFFARVSDETNVTAVVQVLRGSEEVFPKATMTEGPDGNLTYTTNISLEGTYLWRIEVFDSVGRSSGIREGPLTVRDNLGPKFEVRSPSTVVDFQRYGSAAPRIELLVYDNDGVVPTSVEMNVAGLAVIPDIVPAPTGFNGFILSYTVPGSKKFSHRDVVEVTATALDNSSKRLSGSTQFSFIVDDLAPVARVVSITPAYRDQPAHPLNVSLNTRFTLAADDSDGLPTGIASIRYKILGGGNNAAETVYTAPFRITDAPGVYTGPRVYQVQFWAEDSVGNINRPANITTVFVDDTPPALFQFFPQGIFINATFVDDRVGVDRAVAWHRTNAEPYKATPLVESEGVWSLVLPEGKKGDIVSYYLQAWDRLNNTDTFGNATAPYASFDVSNHEPSVKITIPVEGSRVSRNVEIAWTASDEDGDAMVFTLYYRAPGKAAFVEMARLENTEARRYTIDTTRFADGLYTFRVTAGDGGFVKVSDTTVTIINRGSAVGVVSAPPGRVTPGETILLKAEITKAQASVEARLYRGGELVNAYTMNDEGRDGDEVANDGVYSVRVSVDAAGDYSVEIYTTYQEDGELKETRMRDAAIFTATLTPGYVLGKYGTLLVIIGLLAIAGVGVAAFVLIRRK